MGKSSFVGKATFVDSLQTRDLVAIVSAIEVGTQRGWLVLARVIVARVGFAKALQ
jgi:hypothetical protein